VCSVAHKDWAPVEGQLLTQWANEVKPDNVLPEYPRPQLVRDDWLNLNGLWDYAILPLAAEVDEYEGEILVPFPVESALSGVKRPLLPEQRLWYRRNFALPEQWQDQRILLHFGAVDWKAQVWVNGDEAGEHTGGFYPFTLDITELVREDNNELTVVVWDPTDSCGQEQGKQVLDPGGIFYTAVSGIWQTVWLEAVPQQYIRNLKLTPDIDAEQLKVEIDWTGDGPVQTEAVALDDGKEVAVARGGREFNLNLPKAKLWSPESPYLYDLKVRVQQGELSDEVSSYFGMRKLSIGEDQGTPRLFLNNEPLFQHGVLDQGYWPDGLYTAPTDAALKYDLEVTKQLGFNMTRKHIKVEPARWYYHCDKLGLIVWQDMINGGSKFKIWQHSVKPQLIKAKDNKYKASGRQHSANRDNFRKELKEMMDTLYNFPCIAMWVPFNEGWGQFDAIQVAEWVKEYDPTRWVDHASGWFDQGGGDVNSLHIYFRQLKLPKRRDQRPLVISEYGGYSLQIPGHVWHQGKEFGYRKFKTGEELEQAYTALLEDQLQPLIAQGLCAAVYTQITDVETEVNGLMTYDREVIKLSKPLKIY